MTGEKKLRISRVESIRKLRRASGLLEVVADGYVASGDYSSRLLNEADSLIKEVITKHLIFPKGLEQFGPLLSCVSCGHLLFDGRENLSLDVVGDGSLSPVIGLE